MLPTAPSSDPAALPGTLALMPSEPFATPVALLRERRSPSASPSPEGEDNPFAPPPEGQPDQPWRPRGPEGGESGGGGESGSGGDGDGEQGDDGRSRQPHWGSQWSSRQPGRQSGGFGSGSSSGSGSGSEQQQNGGNGKNGGPGGGPGPGGLRWDPTDPLQRRARFALLSGMWGFFFALFSLPEIALLLGALALYWGISSLRGKPVRTSTGSADAGADAIRTGSTAGTDTSPGASSGSAPGSGPGANAKPQTTAAVSGLVTGGLALAIVAATFSLQIVYRDYYTCVDDALTQASKQSCEDLLPKQLRPLLSTQD
jgi:hypothetical protein